LTNVSATTDAADGGPQIAMIKTVLKSGTFPNITGQVSASHTELNLLDGATVTTEELNILDGVTATAAELNTLDGVTATTAELNILDGVTATAAELNTLDGVTATTAELNTLDGVTATAAELNILDGVTATTTELNLLDGVTGTIANQAYVDAVDSYYTLTHEIADVSTAETVYVPVPVSGTVVRVDTCLQGAITTADATVTLDTSADAEMASIVIAQSGSAAGDVATDSSINNGAVTEGSYLKLSTDGASDTAAKVLVTITIQTDTV